jgi:hypothetical protein
MQVLSVGKPPGGDVQQAAWALEQAMPSIFRFFDSALRAPADADKGHIFARAYMNHSVRPQRRSIDSV